MSRLTSAQWCEVLVKCEVKPATAAKWSVIFASVIGLGTFSQGRDEVDNWLGQVLHESMLLERLEENLYYKTPGRLMAVWPSRFHSFEEELPYLRNPEGLANKVYGGRMGNVNPGDGYRYRGSGLIQVTGADNFLAMQEATGIPVFDCPELLRQPTAESLQVTIAWWEKNIPDRIMGDIVRVTKTVNGGLAGLAERQRLTGEADEALA